LYLPRLKKGDAGVHFPPCSADINETLLKCFPEKQSCHRSIQEIQLIKCLNGEVIIKCPGLLIGQRALFNPSYIDRKTMVRRLIYHDRDIHPN
uniref:Uncharacterized protein n=1 Tax=Cyprinodon variegatus TaxID=28743 RepID=A0A3Q2DBC9_CYPVA